MSSTLPTHSNESLAPKWAEGLSHRDRRFVEEYLVDLNATRALKRVGKAYSDEPFADTPSTTALACHKKAQPRIARAIELALAEESISRVFLIDLLAARARAKLTDFVRIEDGRVVVRDTAQAESEGIDTSVLAEISSTEFGITVKICDQQRAIDKLVKVLGMEKDRVEHTGADGGPIEMRDYGTELLAKAAILKAKLSGA